MALKSKYYDEVKITLIDKYKTLVNQCFSIIDREVDESIADDKLHNVLKAKRMAAEDAKYYAKEIELLENEANGIEPEANKEIKKKGAEAHARK